MEAILELQERGSFGINKTFFYVFNLVLIFYFLEVGVYYLLLFKENKRRLLFVTSAIMLFFIPSFKFGNTADFAMRASIPSLIILTFYMTKFLLKYIDKVNLRVSLIVIVFIIGSITPILEYKRAFDTILENKKINCVYDNIKTFSDKSPDELFLYNFLTVNPKETSTFHKYFARK